MNAPADADAPPPDAPFKGQVVRGGAILLGARVATQLFLWSVTLIVARLLTPADYGLMAAGVLLVNLADLLAEAGLGSALVQKKDLRPSDLAESFTISLGLSAGLYALVFAMAGAAGRFYGEPELERLLRVLGLFMLLTPFRALPMAMLERELRLGQRSAAYAAAHVLQGALVLALAAGGAGYWALAVGALVGRALECVMLWAATRWRPALALPGREGRGLLVFGLHLGLSGLITYAYANADLAILGKLTSREALGLYSMAALLMSLPVQKLTTTLNLIAYPAYCRLQHDRARAARWYVRSTVLLMAVGMPALVGLALIADDAFALALGPKWAEAVGPFRILTAVGVVLVVGGSLPPLLNALGRSDLTFRNTLLCAAVLPAAFLAGGLAGGVEGVCYAWLIAYPLVAAAQFHLTRHVTGVGVGRMLYAQAPVLASVLVMSAAVLAARWATVGLSSAPLRVAVAVAAGAVAHAGFLLVFSRRGIVADLISLWKELRGREDQGVTRDKEAAPLITATLDGPEEGPDGLSRSDEEIQQRRPVALSSEGSP